MGVHSPCKYMHIGLDGVGTEKLTLNKEVTYTIVSTDSQNVKQIDVDALCSSYVTDYGHTKSKSQTLCCPNSDSTPELI